MKTAENVSTDQGSLREEIRLLRELDARKIFSNCLVRLRKEHCSKCSDYCRPTVYKCHEFHREKIQEYLRETSTINGGCAIDYWEFIQTQWIPTTKPEEKK